MTEEKTSERCEVVVDSHAVEMYSQRGYRTLEICAEDVGTTQFLNDQQIVPGNSYTSPVSRQVSVVLRTLRFHMVKDGESRIAELSVNLEEVKDECEALKRQVVEDQTAIANMNKLIEGYKFGAEQHRSDNSIREKNQDRLTGELRSMERILEKVRKEIGEHRWREITYDPSDPKTIEAEKARIALLDLDAQVGAEP